MNFLSNYSIVNRQNINHMKAKIIIISICITILPVMLFSQINDSNEKRILEIIDTLKTEYHWPPAPDAVVDVLDRIGAYTPSVPTEEEKKRDELIGELENILSKEDLSEMALIQFLDNEAIIRSGSQRIVIDRLFAMKSESTYNALYCYFLKRPMSQIGVLLARNGKYKEEIKAIVLNDESAPQYLHLFNKATDRIILDNAATYMYQYLKKEPFTSYLKMGIFEYYYNKKFDENIDRYVGKNVDNRDRYDRALDRYYRKCSKNALKYYEKHKNALE